MSRLACVRRAGSAWLSAPCTCAVRRPCRFGPLSPQGGSRRAPAPDVGLQRQWGHGLQRGIHLVAALGHFQAQLVQPVAGFLIVAVVSVGALYVPG